MRLKKIPRTQNLGDMLTHTAGAKELEVFLPLVELVVTRLYKPVTDQYGAETGYCVG